LAWFAGERTRLRRQQLAECEQRALRAEGEVVRERRLAVAEERARIARDLHDSAAHAINVIAVQAGAARLWQEQDPSRSLTALETIEMWRIVRWPRSTRSCTRCATRSRPLSASSRPPVWPPSTR